MVRITSLVLMFLCLLVVKAAFSQNNAEYWISFSGCTTAGECGCIHLMKVDDRGNILIRSTRVVINPAYRSSAILKRGRWIDMWLLSKGAVSRPDPYSVYRAVIVSQTLKLTSIKKTALQSASSSYVHTTQRLEDNFVAIQRTKLPERSIRFLGYKLSSTTGQINSLSQTLTQEFGDCSGCATALAPDGKAFLFTDVIPGSKQLLLQLLNAALQPIMTPKFIAQKRFINVMDVSNPLNSGRRYVLYSPDTLAVYDPLFLQTVNAQTGTPIGESVLLAPKMGFNNAAVIDPLGNFVIYVGEEIPFQGGRFNELIVFQSLDSSGKPVGKKKILGGGNNLDLLKD